MSRELLGFAERAAREAGEILLAQAQRPASGVDTKSSSTDPVSDADRASERFLLDLLARERPDDGILSEEGGSERTTSGYTWVIDPLDGTVNFLYGIPQWAVSLAVEDADGAVIGVVHDPTRDETFSAVRGEGAALNGASIRVNEPDDLANSLIGTGFSYVAAARAVQANLVQRILPKARDIRRGGSAALDLAALACGRLDGFFEAPMERWDKAAGVLIAREAGAKVTDLPPPKEGLPPGVIAAHPDLHDVLRELLLA